MFLLIQTNIIANIVENMKEHADTEGSKEGSRDYAGTDTERHYWVVKLSREEKELAQG